MKNLTKYIVEARYKKPSLNMLNDLTYNIYPRLVEHGSVYNDTYESHVVFIIGDLYYEEENETYILGPHNNVIDEEKPIVLHNYEKLIKDNNTIRQMNNTKEKYEENYHYIGMDSGFSLEYDDFTDLGKELIQIIIKNLKHNSYNDKYDINDYNIPKKERNRFYEIINM